MTRYRPVLLAAAAAVALTACHRKAEDPTVVTPDEQSQLNDAAATLDANGTGNNTDDPS